MKYVYHGSKIQGLKELEKRTSSHLEEWVYASPSKIAATIFINNGGSNLTYYLDGNGSKDSPIILVERKAGLFDEIFNISGSIYALDATRFESGKTDWGAEVVSKFNEPVLHEELINNVLERLGQFSLSGDLALYRYPNRPENVPLDNSDLIPQVVQWNKLGFTYTVDQFLSMYPGLESQLKRELRGNKDTV